MRRPRIGLAIIPAVLTLMVAALPAGAFQETRNDGTTGYYTVDDTEFGPGATCIYENNAGDSNDEFDRVRIKRFHAHGPFPGDSYVGARYVIRKDGYPFGNGYKTVFRSPIVKKMANDAEVAYFGPWTFTAAEGTNAHWQVVIKLFWYSKSSPSTVIGSAQGLIEVYRHRLAGTSTTFHEGGEGNPWYCEAEFWPIPS